MIERHDKIPIAFPKPKDSSPDAAAAMQHLLAASSGEMSTLMNYTFQSFNFRGRRKCGRSTTWSPTSPPRSTATSMIVVVRDQLTLSGRDQAGSDPTAAPLAGAYACRTL
jgi:hypothetical protein